MQMLLLHYATGKSTSFTGQAPAALLPSRACASVPGGVLLLLPLRRQLQPWLLCPPPHVLPAPTKASSCALQGVRAPLAPQACSPTSLASWPLQGNSRLKDTVIEPMATRFTCPVPAAARDGLVMPRSQLAALCSCTATAPDMPIQREHPSTHETPTSAALGDWNYMLINSPPTGIVNDVHA